MATTTPSVEQKQILGAVLIELLIGNLTDETIAAVDTLDRDTVPEALCDVVGFMHGMSTEKPMRFHVTTFLLKEIRGICDELIEERETNTPPIVY